MNVTKFTEYHKKIIDNCGKVIVGKDDIISLVLICFICSGHVLIEDVPGTGKTMLLRAFAKSIGGGFKRIQFTPDLLPSDLTGISFYNQKTGEFEFRQGPLFANIVLADEINRATPRTQSSLLEAMEERQITVDGVTRNLDEPFMVMATQNPIESYGTFPLPEAQIDRFFMRLRMGYMTRTQEMSVLQRRSTIDIVNSLECVVTPEETEYIKNNFQSVSVSDDVLSYIMDIIDKTRADSSLVCGVSTRGAAALYKAAQANAAFAGRDYVIPEDVKALAPRVLSHRISSNIPVADARTEESFIEHIVNGIHVPVETV